MKVKIIKKLGVDIKDVDKLRKEKIRNILK